MRCMRFRKENILKGRCISKRLTEEFSLVRNLNCREFLLIASHIHSAFALLESSRHTLSLPHSTLCSVCKLRAGRLHLAVASKRTFALGRAYVPHDNKLTRCITLVSLSLTMCRLSLSALTHLRFYCLHTMSPIFASLPIPAPARVEPHHCS